MQELPRFHCRCSTLQQRAHIQEHVCCWAFGCVIAAVGRCRCFCCCHIAKLTELYYGFEALATELLLLSDYFDSECAEAMPMHRVGSALSALLYFNLYFTPAAMACFRKTGTLVIHGFVKSRCRPKITVRNARCERQLPSKQHKDRGSTIGAYLDVGAPVAAVLQDLSNALISFMHCSNRIL